MRPVKRSSTSSFVPPAAGCTSASADGPVCTSTPARRRLFSSTTGCASLIDSPPFCVARSSRSLRSSAAPSTAKSSRARMQREPVGEGQGMRADPRGPRALLVLAEERRGVHDVEQPFANVRDPQAPARGVVRERLRHAEVEREVRVVPRQVRRLLVDVDDADAADGGHAHLVLVGPHVGPLDATSSRGPAPFAPGTAMSARTPLPPMTRSAYDSVCPPRIFTPGLPVPSHVLPAMFGRGATPSVHDLAVEGDQRGLARDERAHGDERRRPLHERDGARVGRRVRAPTLGAGGEVDGHQLIAGVLAHVGDAVAHAERVGVRGTGHLLHRALAVGAGHDVDDASSLA